jgi:hypothetical protein
VRRLLPVLCAVLFSVHTNAQTPYRIQLFGGYSYLGYSVYQIYSGPWTNYGFNDDLLNHNKSAFGTDQGDPGPRSHLRISTGVTFRF